MLQDRLEAVTFFLGIDIHQESMFDDMRAEVVRSYTKLPPGRNSRPIPAKRVNTFKYLRSTSKEEKLDAEVTHREQNG